MTMEKAKKILDTARGKADAEAKACPFCRGTRTRTVEIGPASDRTYEEKCPHGIPLTVYLEAAEILGIEIPPGPAIKKLDVIEKVEKILEVKG